MIFLINSSTLTSFMFTAMCCGLIIFLHATSSDKRLDIDHTLAVQAAHTAPTPRIGGLAVFLGLMTAGVLDGRLSEWDGFELAVLSSLPVFVFGLAEDLGISVRPRNRLIASLASGILFILIFEQWLLKTGVPWFDTAMAWTPFAIFFSLFLAVGVSHAFNLIDGLNGISGGTAVAASIALAIIADGYGLTQQRDALLIIGAAVLGFLFFNFPFGRIFLGDAGAYVIGHLLVWVSISILWDAKNATPFAVLLIFFWPIADTCLAIFRRAYSRKSITQPDRLHFHQLVMRGLRIVSLGIDKRLSNPLATILIAPFIIAPMIAGVLFVSEPVRAFAAFLLFSGGFLLAYKIGFMIVSRFRRSLILTPENPASACQKVKNKRRNVRAKT